MYCAMLSLTTTTHQRPEAKRASVMRQANGDNDDHDEPSAVYDSGQHRAAQTTTLSNLPVTEWQPQPREYNQSRLLVDENARLAWLRDSVRWRCPLPCTLA